MLPAPSERLASTNSFSRSDSVSPRTIRAMYGQVKSTITRITTLSPGWMWPPRQPSFVALHAATIPIEMSSCGTASITSEPRERAESVQPPRKPAISPTTRPISTAIPDATTPTMSEVRAPTMVRTKRSRPAESAPNQNCRFGPYGTPKSSSIVSGNVSFGPCPVSFCAIQPPKIARKTSRMTTTPPASAALSCLKRAQKSCRGLRPAVVAGTTAPTSIAVTRSTGSCVPQASQKVYDRRPLCPAQRLARQASWSDQPARASAPPTTSRISWVISAWRARFIWSVTRSINSPAFFDAFRIAVIWAAWNDAADSSSAR